MAKVAEVSGRRQRFRTRRVAVKTASSVALAPGSHGLFFHNDLC